MHYDTIYASQDRKEDIIMGVKSTAVLLDNLVRPFSVACTTLLVASLFYAGIINEQTPIFFVLGVGGTAMHLLFQHMSLDLGSPESCESKTSRII
jgi:4-hydroxybenzoate polyprenyltransferase